jgi:hypothetical protein
MVAVNSQSAKGAPSGGNIRRAPFYFAQEGDGLLFRWKC